MGYNQDRVNLESLGLIPSPNDGLVGSSGKTVCRPTGVRLGLSRKTDLPEPKGLKSSGSFRDYDGSTTGLSEVKRYKRWFG